jgi:hypothetical protein
LQALAIAVSMVTAFVLNPRNSTEAMLMFFAILTFVTAASVSIPSVSLLLLCAGIGALILRLYL